MDFRLNDEQSMLKDSLGGWLARNYGFDRWRKLTASAPAWSQENWATFAEMGWLGIGIPPEHGGLGFGAVEQMIAGEAFGYRLVVEPYLSTIMLGCGALTKAGSEAQKAEWLPRIAAGDARFAFAQAERRSRFDLDFVETRAERTGDGHVISGEKILVLDADAADRLIVLARTGGGVEHRDGLSLFLVDPAAPGISRRDYATVDDRRAADIVFDRAPAEALIGAEGGAHSAVEAVTDEAVAYLCAEAVGAMQALFDQTLAYVKTRRQFGKPIGEFQVIQHRMVELRVQIECARAMAIHAASALAGGGIEAQRAVSAAKVQIGRSGRIVGRNAIQLHGGIGMTNELAIGHYFKRLLMIETWLGDIDHHQRRFAALPSPLA